VKYKHILLIVFIILLLDQAIKVYIKTHFYLNESVDVLGSWFKLHFIENEGMAFGMTILDAPLGKLLLSLFRLVAVSFGFYWVYQLSKKGYGKGLLICAALILAGAAGNLIDSMFYGLIFTESDPHVAQLVSFGAGYAPFLHGKVVDMFYFDLIDTTWPEWMPFVGGKNFRFFEPIFNLADAAISIGIITLLLFQKRLLGDKLQAQQQTSTLEHSSNDSSSL
jgi:signal peptidase II